jgi:hypothetical protein
MLILAGQPDSSPDTGIAEQPVGDWDSYLISYWHTMWGLSDVCRLLANNAGLLAINSGRRGWLLARPKKWLFAGPAIYVFRL